MAYRLQGSLLEVCTCKILCPCWVGEDPDLGDCKSVMAWHFDQGTIDGVDVAGRTIGLAVYIPGNVLDGNWRVTMFIDDGATDEQAEAIQVQTSNRPPDDESRVSGWCILRFQLQKLMNKK